MNEIKLKEYAKNIRKNILLMTYEAQSGHIGGSFSATEILTYLYFEEMNINIENAKDINRDRFILSKGHATPVLYSVLTEKGIINKEDLLTFRQVDSYLQGHPNMNMVPGIDMSTGSLGQGISCAVGMALANKIDNNSNRIYCLIGDGECEEGQVWEAAMAAAHYKLDNLCVILDLNHLQIDGDINDVMNPEPLDKKFNDFNWEVKIVDGHNYFELEEAFKFAKTIKNKPTIIIANTIKGKGVSFMENNYVWHGCVINEEQYKKAIKEIDDND